MHHRMQGCLSDATGLAVTPQSHLDISVQLKLKEYSTSAHCNLAGYVRTSNIAHSQCKTQLLDDWSSAACGWGRADVL